jgi:hypothetical protein
MGDIDFGQEVEVYIEYHAGNWDYYINGSLVASRPSSETSLNIVRILDRRDFGREYE